MSKASEGEHVTLKEAVEAAVKSKANLGGANLGGANLDGANLDGAYLRGAYLDGAYLDDHLTWAQYLADVVPALLTAGGKQLAEVATAATWACHAWRDKEKEIACPIATAFDCSSLDGVPALYRREAARFIALFDAGLVPMPGAPEPVGAENAA